MKTTRTMLKAGIVIILVFVIGFFAGIGALGTFLYIKGPPVPFFKDVEHFPPPPGPPLRLEKIARDIDLSEQQRIQIEQILDQARNRMRGLRKKIKPELKKVFEQTRREIRALLDEDQQQQFDLNIEKIKARSKKFRRKFDGKEHKKGGKYYPPEKGRPPVD